MTIRRYIKLLAIFAIIGFAGIFLSGYSLANEGGSKKSEGFYDAVFVELDPLILPIVDGGRVVQSVTIVISLDVPSESDADKARALQPKLADAFITVLYELLNEHSAIKKDVVQTSVIKKRLYKEAVDILGEKHVNGVLLQVVQQRPV